MEPGAPENREVRAVWPVAGENERWYSLEELPPEIGVPVRRIDDILVPVEVRGVRPVTAEDSQRLNAFYWTSTVGLMRHEVIWREATAEEAAPVLAGEDAAYARADRWGQAFDEHKALADVFYRRGTLYITPDGVPGQSFGGLLETNGATSEFVFDEKKHMWWVLRDPEVSADGKYDNPAGAPWFGYRMKWDDELAQRISALGPDLQRR